MSVRTRFYIVTHYRKQTTWRHQDKLISHYNDMACTMENHVELTVNEYYCFDSAGHKKTCTGKKTWDDDIKACVDDSTTCPGMWSITAVFIPVFSLPTKQ